MRVGVRDVARLAQVSPATVSRVVRGGSYVKSATEQRVRQAIERLGYRPNTLARNLKQQRSNTIGFVLPDIANPFFSMLARGVENYARGLGYDIVLYDTDGDPERELSALEMLWQKRVDGVILNTERAELPGVYNMAAGTPVVLVDNKAAGVEADFVATDNVKGARMLVDHLTGVGHRRIAVITGPKAHSSAIERLEGYIAALGAVGRDVDEGLIRYGDFKTETGYSLARELIGSPNPPDAMFVANNLMTIGALLALRDRGVRIPDEMAIASFDDVELGSLLHPPLTAVAQPAFELGRVAARLLIRRLRANKPLPYRTVRLEPTLIIRSSCGARAKADGTHASPELCRPTGERSVIANEIVPGRSRASRP